MKKGRKLTEDARFPLLGRRYIYLGRDTIIHLMAPSAHMPASSSDESTWPYLIGGITPSCCNQPSYSTRLGTLVCSIR